MPLDFLGLSEVDACVQHIQKQTSARPLIAVVLGSGWGAFADSLVRSQLLPYASLPHFPRPSVEGHSGQMVFGKIGSHDVVVLKGRVHFYEGYRPDQVVFPIRVLARMGVKTLFLTNAAGGLDPKMSPGDFMLIEDHINLTGWNPLVGPNWNELGPRFPDMSRPYDSELLEKMSGKLARVGASHTKGVYLGLTGPTYETPAEVRLYQKMGAQAVGMSTVPETIVAHHAGMRVGGISCITNLGTGISQQKLSHEDVTAQAKVVENVFCEFLKLLISEL